MVYSIADPFYINKYNLYSAVTSFSRSLNIYIIWLLKLSYPKKIYFILRLVVVILFSWYSVMYGLNHSNAYPIRNIPVYITVSPGRFSFSALVLSLSDIYIRYPLSPIYDLLYLLIISNLSFTVPILISFLLRASILPST